MARQALLLTVVGALGLALLYPIASRTFRAQRKIRSSAAPTWEDLLADPELQKALSEAMAKAMQDPKVANAFKLVQERQEALQDLQSMVNDEGNQQKVQELAEEAIKKAGEIAAEDPEVKEILEHVMEVQKISKDPETRKQAQEVAKKAAEAMAIAGADAMKDPKVAAAVVQAQELQTEADELKQMTPQAVERARELSKQARQTMVTALKKAENPFLRAKAEEYMNKFGGRGIYEQVRPGTGAATRAEAMQTVQAAMAQAGAKVMQDPLVKEAVAHAMKMKVQAEVLAKTAADPEIQQKAEQAAVEAIKKIGEVAMKQPKIQELIGQLQKLQGMDAPEAKAKLMAQVQQIKAKVGPMLMNDPTVKAAIEKATQLATSDKAMKKAMQEAAMDPATRQLAAEMRQKASELATDPERLKKAKILLQQDIDTALKVANDPAVQEKAWPKEDILPAVFHPVEEQPAEEKAKSGSRHMAAWAAPAIAAMAVLAA